jgi:hypothetical protein
MIVLIVVIALGVLLFVLQKAGVLQRGPGDPNAEGIMPWTEWESRQKLEAEPVEEAESAPALLIGGLKYDGNLRLAGTSSSIFSRSSSVFQPKFMHPRHSLPT